MSEATYHIEDEPRPGALQRAAVQPFWPLFSIMFAGSWLALPWFAFNGFAVGSPTRWREAGLALTGLFGTAVLAITLLVLRDTGRIPGSLVPYLEVLITVWKLGVCYLLLVWQSRSIALYEYFGGVLANGLLVIVVARVLAPTLLKGFRGEFWSLVLR